MSTTDLCKKLSVKRQSEKFFSSL